jgi:hypothetical protein
MNELSAGSFERARRRGGISTINGGAIHVAAQQAHDFAALEID